MEGGWVGGCSEQMYRANLPIKENLLFLHLRLFTWKSEKMTKESDGIKKPFWRNNAGKVQGKIPHFMVPHLEKWLFVWYYITEGLYVKTYKSTLRVCVDQAVGWFFITAPVLIVYKPWLHTKDQCIWKRTLQFSPHTEIHYNTHINKALEGIDHAEKLVYICSSAWVKDH